ncbi:MAG: TIGR01777 family protein, partial [Gammaproteobacteria bacterium]
MDLILTLIIAQAFIGAYDTIYHHDLREGLPFRPTAALELKIHSMRSFLYSVLFFTMAWSQPRGL